MNLASLADQNLERFGEYPRLVFEGQCFTNRELHEASLKLATALGDLGLLPDDKVVVLLKNCPEMLVSYPAIWRAGGVVVPVLFLLEAHELSYILRDSRARAVITSSELYPKVRDAAQGIGTLEHVIVVGAPESVPVPGLVYEDLLEKSAPVAAPVQRSVDDLAVVLYTSGTTGSPKGVMQTHGNLHANALNSWNSSTRKELHQVSLLVLPLAHSFGLGVLIGGYLFGGKAVLMRWFEAEGALKLLQEHRVQAMAGVPTMYVYLLNHPEASAFDTSSCKRWLVGAAPMPDEQKRQFEAKFGGTMYVGYGLTESCPGIATEREDWPRKPGSCGVPMEGVDVKIVDDDARELPRNQLGEICARGKNISPGYYEMPEATRETFRDGWLHTGDVGYLDDDGYLFIVERKKDLVIRGGLNVYPKDVEEVLARHPAVRECAVVGVPDALLGEEVLAFVVKKTGVEVSEAELMLHCRATLAKYKTPKSVEFLPELPKTTIGKIQKKELRKLAVSKLGTVS